MRSNCFIWAVGEYCSRYAAWAADGMPADDKPRLVAQPSISQPHWLPHWQVHGFGPALEFVPVARRDLPWWMLWTRIVFDGAVRRVGDKP